MYIYKVIFDSFFEVLSEVKFGGNDFIFKSPDEGLFEVVGFFS